MKKLSLLLIVLCLICVSCSTAENEQKEINNKPEKSLGEIIKADFRQCICCGGYFIKIENENYLFDRASLPENDLNFNDLPIYVLIEWDLDMELYEECNITIGVEPHIIITSIEQI